VGRITGIFKTNLEDPMTTIKDQLRKKSLPFASIFDNALVYQ
jgi:hypothetical protein